MDCRNESSAKSFLNGRSTLHFIDSVNFVVDVVSRITEQSNQGRRQSSKVVVQVLNA